MLALMFGSMQAQAVATGTYTYGTGGTYPTLAAAITALNTTGITGGAVILNVQPGYTAETAPAGGFRLGSAILNATFSSTNTLTINGAPTFTITAQAGTGTYAAGADGILNLEGVDYTTLNGLKLQDAVSNNTEVLAMEFGISMVKRSAVSPFDGCQNNTIQNCTITLNRSILALTLGINMNHCTYASTTALGTVTLAADANSNNKFYSNTISNCQRPIYIQGFNAAIPYTFYDQNNDIGGTSAATGNNLTNWGGLTTIPTPSFYSQVYGIFAWYQNNLNVSYNIVDNVANGGSMAYAGIMGIWVSANNATCTINNNTVNIVETPNTTTAGSPSASANGIVLSGTGQINTCNNNIVSVTTIAPNNNTNQTFGIINLGGGNYTANNNNVTINQGVNVITNGMYTSATGAIVFNGNTIDISAASTSAATNWIINAATATSFTVQNCIFKSATGIATTSGSALIISNNTGTPTNNILNNRTQGTIVKSGSGGQMYGYFNFGTPTTSTETITGNNFSNITTSGTTQFIGIRTGTNTTHNRIITFDTISNVTCGSTASAGIAADYLSSASTVNNNRIVNVSGTGNVYGIHLGSTATLGTVGNSIGGTVQGNYINGLSSSGASSTITGIYNHQASGTITTNLDTVLNLTSTGGTSPLVVGIQQQAVGTNNVISRCIISGLATSGATGNATVNGILMNGSVTPSIFKNNISNLNAGPGTGTTQVVGINLLGASTAYNVHNNFVSDLVAGSSANVNGIVGINAATTGSSWGLYYNTIYIGAGTPVASSGANFGAQGVLYPNGGTLLTLKNNIINVNVTPSGTGFGAAVARNYASATACTAPATTNFIADNNIYYTNPGTNNYLYVDGTNTSNLKNGFALGGITANVTNNIVVDSAFNLTCSGYKLFMTASGRESMTSTENNLVAGSVAGTYAPSGASLAESRGVAITSPSITDDHSGTTRTVADIGAMQFSGTVNTTALNPVVSALGPLNFCNGGDVTLAVSPSSPTLGYQWLKDGSVIPGATNSTYSATLAGVYTASVVVTGACAGSCAILSGNNVTTIIDPSPTVASLGAVPSSVCVGTPITFTAGAIAGPGTFVSYNWSGPDGFSTTGTSNTVGLIPPSTSAAGIYSVTVTYSGSGCTSAAAVANVTITSPPPAITGSYNTCIGTTTTLGNVSPGGTWASANTGVATVHPSSGAVTGVSAGTVDITYTLTGGCIAVANVTVNPNAFANTGLQFMCVNAVTTLSNPTTGGTWSSSNPAVASIADNTVGDILGVANGTARITYTNPTGCIAVSVVTVNGLPYPIVGLNEVCEGYTLSLTTATPGGTWSSSNPAVGTVSTSGTITNMGGVANGTLTVSYTLSTGCYRTHAMTVNVTPTVNSVPVAAAVCVESSIPLTGVPAGGTWNSNVAFATVGITSGIVTGVNASSGTTGITYTLPTGCRSVKIVTVNPVPFISTALPPLCVGANSTQTATIAGGDWVSDDPTIADVTIGTGFVTAMSPGTTTISYILPTGCYRAKVATVNAVPTPITGGNTVCVAQTLALSSSPALGTWSSTVTPIVTVNSTTGVVTGLNAGTSIVTYTVNYPGPSQCRTTLQVSVNPQPAAITGTAKACPGTTTTLNSTTTGGTWSTSDASVADILVPSSGVVTGVSAGTATVTYTIGTGCFRTVTVTINALPAVTAGSLAICPGTTTAFSSTTGGTWSSSNTAVGTINASTGLAAGLTAGTTNITYKLTSTGCMTVTELTVNPTPAPIDGSAVLCVGSTSALSNVDGGGTWVSSNPLVGTIDGAGVVTGINMGTTTITYTLGTGCRRTLQMTVNATPGPIGGTLEVCEASTANLIGTPGGGTWSSSNTAVGTVGSSTGVVAGISAGTTDITYSLGGVTGCMAISTVTVNPRPQPITGFPSVCIGSVTTLSSITLGGTWSSGMPTLATVDPFGNVTGLLNGNASISYTLSTGCARVQVVAVNQLPLAISGADVVCVGSNITLTNSSTGGTWSTSDATKATITTTGVVTGTGAGTVIMSYILPTGCFRTKALTVNALPAAISAPATVCVGSTVTLTSTPASVPAGTWSSSAAVIGSIDPVTGVLSGLVGGTTTISYVNAQGCRVTNVVTVLARPTVISGSAVVCVGGTSTLNSTPAGGLWSTDDNTVADILPGTGYMTGINAGTTDITYTAVNGCTRSVTATVNPLPDVIGGVTHEVCVGSAIMLTNTVAGGTWSTSLATVATVNATSGLVYGVSAGTAYITYKLSTSCFVTDLVTVNPLPTAITGSASVCMGFSTVLSTLTPGGTWSSGNTGVATVSLTGVVSSVAPGTSTISYTSTSGCIALKVVTVHALPAAIAGSLSVCSGTTTVYTNTSAPGTWSSSNVAVGTISSLGAFNALTAGTTAITYTNPTGCYTVSIVTVNTLPATITGVAILCSGGSTSTLTSATMPGTWSSSNLSVATIDVGTGTVTSGAIGTSTISYTGANGCTTTRIVTVVLTPSPIVSLPSVCQGSSISMISSPGGGTWSSTVPSVGTITSTTGAFTGVSAGVTTISYVTSNGCGRSTTVTVSPTATLTSGPALACVGSTITLTYDLAGGSWTSGSTGVATVDLSTGVVTGVAAGVANITYLLPSGCRTVTQVTVNAQPSTTTGTATVCLGLSTTLSNSTPGIVWSSANAGIATVGSATGIVVGTGVGAVDITATNPLTGCARVTTVTVNSLPAAIAGSLSMCIGNTSTLSNSVLGGTWSSSATSVASVGMLTGVVTGITSGTSTITYKLSTGCQATRVVTVQPAPTAITGVNNVCVNGTTTYFTPTLGGVWSSSNNAIAQVGTNGVVTGFSPGVANISYVLATTCFVTKTVTVLPMVSPIAGVTGVCEGSQTNLSTLTPGGTWSSGNTFVAIVGLTTGLVTGQAAGTSIITYTAPTGCTDTALVTVNPVPSAIMGIPNMCQGSTTTLSNLTIPGTWSSGNPIIASVDGTTGVVTGNSVGTARITYTIGTGCRTTQIVSVTPLPGSITGSAQVCEGSNTSLGISTPGGTWSSVDETIAIVGTTGVVSGIAAGTTTISYTLPTGCASSVIVTVNAVPDPIGGVAEVCLGATTTLTATPAGGAWTSGSMTVATIGVSTGLLTGTGVGVSVITYTLPTGCRAFKIATVHALPGAIGGVTNICQGGSTILTNPVPGGIWSSDFISVAYIDPATGEVTGNSIGVDTIRYTLTGGCSTKITITVNEAPTAITGDFEICLGETTTLTPPAVGGTWSSSNTSVATIGATSGIVTSHSAGSTEISYTLGAGCMVHSTFVVDPSPSAIVGPHEVCSGQSITLLNSIAGGTWTSTNSSVATVDGTTGVVTGGASGTATIVYQLPGSCFAQFIVTVNSLPAPITGLDSICQGASATFSSVPTGGIWTSNAPAIAPVNLVSGEVTGISVGNAVISYTLLGTGCYRTKNVTVNPVPAPITGTYNTCVGATTLLSTTTVGGTWTSSNTSVALVGSTTGLVQGLSAGTATIMNILPTGCSSSALIVVNPQPANITGPSEICVGSAATMTDATPFGSWSSSNPSVATIDAASGLITGVVSGNTTITYTLFATGCSVIKQVTVNPLPPSITGVQYMCLGSISFVANPIPGGTWSSSNTAVTTIDGFGNVTATGVGTSTITYELTSACYITRMLTVEPTLNPITGPSTVCEGATITLANTYVGGSWSTGTPSVATVGTTGIVTGVTAGVANISYATPLAHCFVVKQVTVDPVPAAIFGADEVCVGATTALTVSTPGGTWSSSDDAVATVDASGVVIGVVANTAVISYIVGSGCAATLPMTVKPLANAGAVSGATEVCVASTIALTSSGDAGGTWSSADITIATVGTSGVVTGVAVGTTTISYVVENDCSIDTATYVVTVNPLPDAGTLSATTAGLCITYTTTVSSTKTGGVWTSSAPAVASIDAAGVVTALTAGTVTISYTMTSGCGVDVATINITVYSKAPHTAISIHSDSVLCAGAMFRNFGAQVAPGSGTSFIWTAVNAEIYAQSEGNRQNALVNFPNPGTAIVRLTTQITSTGCYVVDSFTVEVGADTAFTPEVKYFQKEFICTDNTSSMYQWGYDDAASLDSTRIPGGIQQSYYQPNPDFTNRRYWVISEHNGCFQKTYYNVPTDVRPEDVNMVDVRLYPNPADTRVNIEVRGITMNDNITIKVVDMLGREIQNVALVNGKGSIDVASLASGMYSVVFFNNGDKVTAKTFVKN
ncbi:hypothetical protein GCM10023093_18370 [Nemorincola caseinilytica]|uniref:BIG2 domain-containing protein n=1 Tax=Nemorincola caseinilytica TaxID=2054315 RepID=A0ABP8NH18_9BACT